MSTPLPLQPFAPENQSPKTPAIELVNRERKLRVLHVGKYYPPHPGGMESHLQALCEELKSSIDLEVVVAASNGSGTSEEVVDSSIKLTRTSNLLNLRSAPFCPEMVSKIRASNADVVHIHWPNPGAVLAYLASGHHGRLIITYHSDIIRQNVLRRFFDPILRHALNRADAIIVSSSNYLESSYVLPQYKKKCRVIPFGISLDQFQRPDAAVVARIRKRFGSRIVLAVGRLVYYKGFEHLIEAMKSVEGRLV